MSNGIAVVTGANGYVGYALVRQLAEDGIPVRATMRRPLKIFDDITCEVVLGDVTDYDFLLKAFEGAETVYHVAGVVDITGTKDDLVWNVNYEATKKVIDACKACGVKNLVYTSSVDCVHVTDDMQPIREFTHYDPDTIEGAYGKSKAAASQYVIDSDCPELKCCVIQPSCCIGPYDIFGTNSVCTMIGLYNKGLFPVTLNFGGYNFVDVRDVAKGMIATAEKGRGGESYFLCGDKMTVDEFIKTLAKINNKKPPKIALGKGLLLKLCPAIEAFFKLMKWPPVLTPFSINKICENCSFSYEKAETELGYKPLSAEESLIDTVNWLKEHPPESK